MIVEYLSLGSAFWQRTAFDPETQAMMTRRSAYFNTSGFCRGKNVTWGHRKSGFIRINATVLNLRCKQDLLGRRYQTSGVEEYRNSARLLLRALARKGDEEDGYIVAVTSAEFGHINFSSNWKDPGVKMIASSFRSGEQETLLLLMRGASFTTTLGKWGVVCNSKSKHLELR